MNTTIKILTVVAFLMTTGMESAMAHHSFAMFDRSREEFLTGTIRRWAFNSPHIALYMETENGTLFSLEGAAPPSVMSRSPSMNGFTFQPGQTVSVVYCPLHDGRPGGALGYIIDAQGTFYSPNDGGCGPSPDWEEWVKQGYTSRAEAEAAQ